MGRFIFQHQQINDQFLNMFPSAAVNHNGFKRLSDLRAQKDNIKRVFGKDITNFTRKLKPQPSNKNILPEPQLKHRSVSVNPVPKKVSEVEIDPICEYRDEILGQMMAHELRYEGIGKEERSGDDQKRKAVLNKIISIHSAFGLKEQTLFLTLAYFKQFLSKESLPSTDYQLAAVVCLWIAAKYEEIYPPRTKHFVGAVSGCTFGDLQKMEGKIIQALDFNLVRTTPLLFLDSIVGSSSKSHSLAAFLLEACQIEYSEWNFKPSLQVMAAVKLADYIFKQKTQNSDLQKKCNYQKEHISGCFKHMCRILQSNGLSSSALRKKFADEKFHQVSKIRLEPKA